MSRCGSSLEDRFSNVSLDMVIFQEGLEPLVVDVLPESPYPVSDELNEEDAVVMILAATLLREVLPADATELAVNDYLLDVELYSLGEGRFPQLVDRLEGVVHPGESRGTE